MMEFINVIAKGNEAFYISFWVKILAFALYTDLFFSIISPLPVITLDSLLSDMNQSLIILFIIGVIASIIIMLLISAVLHFLYLHLPLPVKDKASTKIVHSSSMRQYAILTNNQVAYMEAIQAERNMINNYIQVGTLLLFCLDLQWGTFMSIIEQCFPGNIERCEIGFYILSIFLLLKKLRSMDVGDRIIVSSEVYDKVHHK